MNSLSEEVLFAIKGNSMGSQIYRSRVVPVILLLF